MSEPIKIFTQGWFDSVETDRTAIFTQGWFETSAIPTPSDLTAQVLGYTELLLTWVDQSLTEGGFRIERSPAGLDDWTILGETGPDVEFFVDYTPIPGIVYDYRVIAFNEYGESDPAVITDISTPIPGEIPLGPPPTPVEPDRNRMGPIEVDYVAPNVYGRETDRSGNVIGNKF